MEGIALCLHIRFYDVFACFAQDGPEAVFLLLLCDADVVDVPHIEQDGTVVAEVGIAGAFPPQAPVRGQHTVVAGALLFFLKRFEHVADAQGFEARFLVLAAYDAGDGVRQFFGKNA